MSNKANEELSRLTFAAMDLIGYSKEMIESRADMWGRLATGLLETIKQILPGSLDQDIILSGSRGEGIAKLLESDIDIMTVHRNFLCLDNAQFENGLNIIQIISDDSPPGYAKLNPLDFEGNLIGEAVLGLTSVYDINRGQLFISSACARNLVEFERENLSPLYEGFRYQTKEQRGPSVPCSAAFNIPAMPKFNWPATELDIVLALPYISSSILGVWRKRNRKWPSPQLCKEISETEGFVVPVGASFSEEQNFEWRISFTKCEQFIVANLNSVQLKLYILLKMIFKTIVKPRCDMVSSYMIKNVVFWIAERSDQDMFTPDNLIELLLNCLAFLQECLHANFLPNYMLPSRNLLLGKGSPLVKVRLHQTLTELLKDGEFVVMRLDIIRNSMTLIHQSPVSARRYHETRDGVEKLFILTNFINSSNLSPALLQRSTLVYDLYFELYKDPSFFGIMFSLMNLLNVDLLSIASNPEQVVQLVYSLLS